MQDELRELVTQCGGHVIGSPRRARIRVGQWVTVRYSLPAVKETWILGKHILVKGPSINDVHTQGEGVCLVRTCFGQGEILQMRTSAFFDPKNFGFFEFYGVSARTKRERVNFSIVRTSFMDDPVRHRMPHMILIRSNVASRWFNQ